MREHCSSNINGFLAEKRECVLERECVCVCEFIDNQQEEGGKGEEEV